MTDIDEMMTRPLISPVDPLAVQVAVMRIANPSATVEELAETLGVPAEDVRAVWGDDPEVE